MSGVGARLALIIGSLAAGGGGWYGAGQLRSDNNDVATELDIVPLYDCPTPGGASIGSVVAGTQLELVGVTDDRWAVIRHPDESGRLAWLSLAMIESAANAGDLPELTCGQAATVTETSTAVATTTTQLIVETTTSTTTSTTSTTSTTIATSTTVSSDLTPPTVTLTANRAYFYSPPVNATCTGEERLEVTVVISDPTVPLTVRSIQAAWTGPSGAQSAALTPLTGNRFLLVINTNGPTAGELPVTITATGSDGAGNIGSGQLIVPLRHAASYGCG